MRLGRCWRGGRGRSEVKELKEGKDGEKSETNRGVGNTTHRLRSFASLRMTKRSPGSAAEV